LSEPFKDIASGGDKFAKQKLFKCSLRGGVGPYTCWGRGRGRGYVGRGAATAAANHIKEMSRYVRPQANKYKKYS